VITVDTANRERALARVGQVLKAKWHLDALLGVGGMAAVYAATHRNKNRAAVKVLHPDLAAEPTIRARFHHEGYAANAVAHPGVVRVLDDDETDDGVVFLVMELLEGETYDRIADRCGGRLPYPEVLSVANAVLDVLVAAHQKRILHRDLKPDNIFMTNEGLIKVLDFGLARVLEPALQAGRLPTSLGSTMGTPGFMPPEQARGEWDQVDATSDLWAVGATMFTLLTGRSVHESPNVTNMLVMAATKPAPPIASILPGLPRAVVDLVDRALAFERSARWPDALHMKAAVQEAMRPSTQVSARNPFENAQPPRGSSNTGHDSPSRLPAIVSAKPLDAPVATFSPVASAAPSVFSVMGPASPRPDASIAASRMPFTAHTPTHLPAPRAAMKPPTQQSPSAYAGGASNGSRHAPPTLDRPEVIAPVEIAKDTYWVGKRDPKSIFHANPYLRIFRGPSGDPAAPFCLLVDPGSSSDFAVVSAKVGSLIGGMNKLSAIFVNHQDPDVGSSASVITARYAPHASILCSEATWRLIVHFNLPHERFVDTDKFARGMELPTGHVLVPVPSPFCHFRGAVMLYDPETRVLFTGDLFGGLTPPEARGLWADESDWAGIRTFHQTYMPTNRVLVRAIDAIRRLEPEVEIIAPQHGRLLRGPLLTRFMDRLAHLPVGLDILDDVDDVDLVAAWNSVLRRVVRTARMVLGHEADERLAQHDELRDTLRIAGDDVTLTSLGRWTVSAVVDALTVGQTPTIANPIKLEAILACEELELPSPEIRIEEGDGVDPTFGGLAPR
jgi:serine/threonine protein kinase/glyoxylase-like metal-dependent hydrolase (beta-lactamase superfamily II)